MLSPAQIAQLPERRVVIIRRGMPPAVGRVRMAWKRHDVRHASRVLRRMERAGHRADFAAAATTRLSGWFDDAVRWVAAATGRLAEARARRNAEPAERNDALADETTGGAR